MAISVRRAQPGDIPFILDLLDQIRDLHHRGRPDVFKDSGTKYTASELEEKLGRDDECIFVAYDGEQPLGYVCTVTTEYSRHNVMLDKKILYIDDLCVYPSSRGRGVGRMLMDKAKYYAKECGCASMELVCWKFEGSAEGFYRSYGFTTMSRRMEYRIK
ncbi:MAG: GNAT family N-acetyltransferase [Clostridia bacterium]|nr:GNAT family N-acetyltransferase [Clostridia bacterium]MBQ6183685.1 GNAT family N-acetyltransferase [Clostridia bacterium]